MITEKYQGQRNLVCLYFKYAPIWINPAGGISLAVSTSFKLK